MCDKIGYSSEREARTVLNIFRRNRKASYGKKIPKRAYYCEQCGMWHLTSLADYHGGGDE